MFPMAASDVGADKNAWATAAAANLRKRIQHGVVFVDLDDTLLDYQWGTHRTLLELARTAGIPASSLLAVYRRADGETGSSGSGRIRAALAICAPRLSDRGLASSIELYYHERMAHGRPLPGAALLLRTLRHRDPRVVLATRGIDAIQHHRLEQVGLADYFDDVIVSESHGATKGDWNAFLPACYLAPIRSSTIISDSPYPDLIQGRLFGMATVFVDNRHRAAPSDCFDLAVTGPRYLANLLAAAAPYDQGGPRGAGC